MKYTLMTLIAFIIITGCSGSITTNKIADSAADLKAQGLRYFLPKRVEISVYQVTLKDPLPDKPPRHRIDRVGDVIVDTINDPHELWQVNYQGALFANQGVTLTLNEKGAVKSIGLTSQAGSTPVALGTLQAVQTGLETQAKREQAKIDELNRRTNLIKAKQDLEKALGDK
jgi:hypothetical protein